MIDPQNGRITLGTLVIEPSMTEAVFIQQHTNAVVVVENPPFRSLRVAAEPWTIVASFKASSLASVRLSHLLDTDALGWEGWSEDNEGRRKDLHDNSLQEWLGRAPLPGRSHEYPWGTISSDLDLKAGGASIIVCYER